MTLFADSTSEGALTVLEVVSRTQAVGTERIRLHMSLSLLHCHVLELDG